MAMEINHLKVYFLLKSGDMGIFHCHVSLLEVKSSKHQFSGAISVSVAWKKMVFRPVRFLSPPVPRGRKWRDAGNATMRGPTKS